jgi:hypothetical protein
MKILNPSGVSYRILIGKQNVKGKDVMEFSDKTGCGTTSKENL